MRKVFSFLLFIITFTYGNVVAEINDRKITSEEFDRIFYTFWERIAHLPLAKPTKEDKKIFLIEYVRDLIILKEAEKEGITVSEEELEDFINNRIIYRKNVKRKNYSPALINLIKAEIVIEKLLEKLVSKEEVENIPLSKLRAYYEFYKREFRYPTKYKIMAVAVENKKLVREVKKLLEKGIIPHGEGIEVSKPLWYSKSTLPGRKYLKFYAYKVGAVSEPVQLNGKYYIFKILEVKPAGIIPFEEAKERIKLKILREKRKEAFKKWLMEKVQHYRVKFYWENL